MVTIFPPSKRGSNTLEKTTKSELINPLTNIERNTVTFAAGLYKIRGTQCKGIARKSRPDTALPLETEIGWERNHEMTSRRGPIRF
jgi:hypothetical protein